MMDKPFAKSVPFAEKYAKLVESVGTKDVLAILINADPDAFGSALALKRLFWRKAKQIKICRINKIERPDNLALARLLDLRHQHIQHLKSTEVTKWAIVDSQPSHDEKFSKHRFDIIIDHHPVSEGLEAEFIDNQPEYGANSTILTEYLKAARIKPSPRLATALFYGIKTDTDNFVRGSVSRDIIALRYLYEFANLNIIKKIESSELSLKMLPEFKRALHNMSLVGNTAYVHLGSVNNGDILVIVADFLMKLAEANWSIVSGLNGGKLIVIFRNAGFRNNAGKRAKAAFGDIGSAGGHKAAARAEIPVEALVPTLGSDAEYAKFVLGRLKNAKK